MLQTRLVLLYAKQIALDADSVSQTSKEGPPPHLPVMSDTNHSNPESQTDSSGHSPLLLALSGPTSSGKTTVANALSAIFPSSLIIHADDFYKTDSQIPLKDGVQDWDCVESLDLERFWTLLLDVKAGGEVPKDLVHQGGMEDGVHAPTVKGVSEGTVKKLQIEVEAWPEILKRRKIVIVDGFLLFGKSVRHMSSSVFDIRILLRATYQEAKRRRESRNGYVTLEGFWQDPPGYFDKIVWPNFLEEHEWMFHDGDVEGDLERTKADLHRSTVVGPLEVEGGLDGLVRWVVKQLRGEIKYIIEKGEEKKASGG